MFIKNKNLVQVFPYEFYKIFENTYFPEHPRRAACNDMTIPDPFVRFASQKINMYLFNIFKESKDNDHFTSILT